MNAKQYSKFQSAIEHNLKGLSHVSTGACPGCAECNLDSNCDNHQRELAEEPNFSWSSCDSCGSSLGGNRHPAHGYILRDEGKALLIHLDVCEDCLYFLNYGRLDDSQMMEIEKEA